ELGRRCHRRRTAADGAQHRGRPLRRQPPVARRRAQWAPRGAGENVNGLAARVAEFRESAGLAREQTGKPLLTQLREIRALRRIGGECGATDYYRYRLYDEGWLDRRRAAGFMGWRLQTRFSLALNPRNVVLPAWDKVAFTLIASAAGLPVAPVRACYRPGS